MSRSSRKRSSKWDSAEEPTFEDANVQDNGWIGKAGMPFHPKESGREWLSPGLTGSNGSKWSGLEANDTQRSKHDLRLPSREPLPGSRGSHKTESFNKGSNRYMDDSMVWGGDGSCSTRMSPGLDEWRQNRSRSPKSGWSRSLRGRSRSRSRSWSRSRSRSRSPGRGYRRESLFLDRNRSRSGVSAQLCKDFAAGRCRRANDCQFLHEGSSNYDNWESRPRKVIASKYDTYPDTRDYPPKSGRSVHCTDFAKGNCRRGESCKFDHHHASDGFSKGSANEISVERENERRKRDDSTERGAERVPQRSGSIPCKFFSAGNCRNKKYCRFSHHIHARGSPERKPRDGRWGLCHTVNDEGEAWDSKKQSDAVSDPTKLSADNSRNIGVPRSSAWSMNENRWGHGLDNENQKCVDSKVSHEGVERNENDAPVWKEDDLGAHLGFPKSRENEKWLGDMSPDWNYTLKSSNHSGKEEHSHVTRGSETSSQVHGAGLVMQPMIVERSNYLQNKDLREDGTIPLPYDNRNAIDETVSSQNDSSSRNDVNLSENIMPHQSFDHSSSSAFPFSGLSTIGQNQPLMSTHPQGGRTIKCSQDTLSPESKSVLKLGIGEAKTPLVSGISLMPNMVGGKELTQLTNLSASLAQLLGSGQQLPQLYAALNSQNTVSSVPFPKSEASSEKLSAAIQPDPSILSQKPYDPICDSIELKTPELGNNSMCLLPNDTCNTSVGGIVDKPSESVSPSFPSGANGNDYHQDHNSGEEFKHQNQKSSQLEPGAKPEDVIENSELGAEECKNAQEENKSPENDLLEGIEKDEAGDRKKFKEGKGSRAFKFALVEFIKELLKPTWKEGQISKDAYKTMVKKVVDKVTSTMHGASIPQTQDKIDHYLSISKPKLTKLVQAYVEKSQKR